VKGVRPGAAFVQRSGLAVAVRDLAIPVQSIHNAQGFGHSGPSDLSFSTASSFGLTRVGGTTRARRPLSDFSQMAETTIALGTLRTDTPTLVIFLIGFVAIFAVLTRSGHHRHPVHSVTVADHGLSIPSTVRSRTRLHNIFIRASGFGTSS
jgi:hypothetical protein